MTEAGLLLLEGGPAVLAAADELWRAARAYGEGDQGSVLIAYGERFVAALQAGEATGFDDQYMRIAPKFEVGGDG